MLVLVVGAVADPHRASPLISGQMGELLLDQRPLPADAVHHLQGTVFIAVRAGHLGDEREEVVRLPVQAQRVQTPQRERRIAHPRVAVVPIPLATWRFR